MKKFTFLFILALFAAPSMAYSQITIPFSFSNGQQANADDVNTNFAAIGSAALNRTGGTITGNIAVSAGVTIDGVDIGAVLGGTGTPTFATVTTGTLTTTGATATSITAGGGITAGTGSVGIVDATGKIPAISSTYFASLSGTNLTALSASNVSAGTLAVARGGTGGDFSSTAQGNLWYFSAAGTLAALGPGTAGQVLRTGGAAANPSWSNDGSNLTGLNATQLTSGTLPDARLSGTYTGALTFSGALTLSSASNVITGTFKSTDGTAGVTSTTCNFTAPITVKNGLVVAGSGC